MNNQYLITTSLEPLYNTSYFFKTTKFPKIIVSKFLFAINYKFSFITFDFKQIIKVNENSIILSTPKTKYLTNVPVYIEFFKVLKNFFLLNSMIQKKTNFLLKKFYHQKQSYKFYPIVYVILRKPYYLRAREKKKVMTIPLYFYYKTKRL